MNSTNQFAPGHNKIYYSTIWLSDIHLGNRDCHANFLLEFLQNVKCDRLYLVGDIVDMWAMKKKVFWIESHTKVLQEIHRIANDGTEVIYVPGNHDMPMRHYETGHLLNVRLERQFIHETAQGKKLLIVHGDEFDHAVLYHTLNRLIGDHVYELMAFLNRWVLRARRLMGLPYWSLANYLKDNIAQARQTIDTFEKAAAAEAKSRGLDGIVCGHIHKPKLRMIDGIMYCNDGDWTESCSALVEDFSGELTLLEWSDIKEIIGPVKNPYLNVA